jgi:cytochrome c oxidase subunit II
MLKDRLKSVAAVATFGAYAAMTAGAALAQGVVGQPVDKAIGMQPSADGPMGIRTQQIAFHNDILVPIITIITLFVLALLLWIIVRYNKRANKTPAQFSHNTVLEIVWTTVPIIILMIIAVSSFQLLYREHDMPKPDLTVKATGNQWYWSYEYPKAAAGGFSFDSNPLTEEQAKAKNLPFKLAVNNPLVVPAGKTVQVLVTGADVLHAFFIPAFGVQSTAVPGRVNSVWFKAEKPGIYYGQCNELCGVQHYFMPIMVDVRSPADYEAWVASHGKPAVAAAPATTSVTAPAAAPAATPTSASAVSPAAPAAAKPAATQG